MHPFLVTLCFLAAPPPAGDGGTAHGIDVAGMDRTVAPGDDFNAYVSGTWLNTNPIPPDLSSYGIGAILAEDARKHTAELIQEASKGTTPEARQIGDYYDTFMDEKTIEAKRLKPLAPELQAITVIADKKSLAAALGRSLRADVDALNATNFHTDHLFGLWVVQALDDPLHNAPYLLQGGLDMPDREYYLSASPEMAEQRTKHQAHVATMLKLANIKDADAKAARIVAFEKKIATAHATRLESEDLHAVADWKRAELATKAPGLDWPVFLAAAHLDSPRFFMWQPKAIAGLAALVASEPLDVWKEWLTFHAVDDAARFLPKAFVDARFDFHGKALNGVPQVAERWKRGSDVTSDALGEAVGKLFAEKYFNATAKAKAQTIVDALVRAFGKRIDALSWMTPKTRAAAKAKIATLKVGVGYPDAWRDYSGLKVVKGDALGNYERAELFEYQRNLAKLGQAVDRGEWWMTPQTMDAVNLPLQNALNFPAAILQPPFFDPEADPALNFAGMGAVVGHEISHSFDDTGAQFDSEGRIANWWTPEDLEHFKAAGEKLTAQYDAYEPLPGIHVNGHQCLGENIADVAGLAAAWDAWQESLGGKAPKGGQGMTGPQLFFIAYGQSWREKRREPALRRQLITDGHAPEMYRCDTVRNLDGWYAAFGVKPGQKLYLAPADRVHVW